VFLHVIGMHNDCWRKEGHPVVKHLLKLKPKFDASLVVIVVFMGLVCVQPHLFPNILTGQIW